MVEDWRPCPPASGWPLRSSHQRPARSSTRAKSTSSTTSTPPGRTSAPSRAHDSPSGSTWCSETTATAASKGGSSSSCSGMRRTPSALRRRVDGDDVVAGGREHLGELPSPAPISSTRAGGAGRAARTNAMTSVAGIAGEVRESPDARRAGRDEDPSHAEPRPRSSPPSTTASDASSSAPPTPTGTRPAVPGTSPTTSSPAFVAFPETADDVVAIVEHARANGLRVAPQGTGHNAGPLGDLARHASCSAPRA